MKWRSRLVFILAGESHFSHGEVTVENREIPLLNIHTRHARQQFMEQSRGKDQQDMHKAAQAEDDSDKPQDVAQAWSHVAQHPRASAKQQGQAEQNPDRYQQFQPAVTVRFGRHHGAADCKYEIEPQVKIPDVGQGTHSHPEQVELPVAQNIPQDAHLKALDRHIGDEESAHDQRCSADQGVAHDIRAGGLDIAELEAPIWQGTRQDGKPSRWDPQDLRHEKMAQLM